MKLPQRLSLALYKARLALRDPRRVAAARERRALRRENARTLMHFHSEDYLTINGRRLEHLASLGLPLEGRTVLEVGAGVGDLTSFFLARGCEVLSTEARPASLRLLRERLPHVESALLDLDRPNEDWERTAEVVFCYGTLYHLREPAEALAFLRRCCTDLLLLETCVSPGAGIDTNPEHEAAGSPTQAVSGIGCRPTRGWLLQELSRHFPHVYFTRTQPWHPQFPLDWSHPPAGLTRAIAVASLRSLAEPTLTSEIPERQERH